MSEPSSDRPVKITAEHRAHPAIRMLARACIALARQLQGQPPTPPTSKPAGTSAPGGEERAHD
jgi:hypothetical protein